MKCEDVAKLLLPGLTGTLKQADEEAMHAHLSYCRSCAHDLPRFSEVWSLLDILTDEDVPDEVAEKIESPKTIINGEHKNEK